MKKEHRSRIVAFLLPILMIFQILAAPFLSVAAGEMEDTKTEKYTIRLLIDVLEKTGESSKRTVKVWKLSKDQLKKDDLLETAKHFDGMEDSKIDEELNSKGVLSEESKLDENSEKELDDLLISLLEKNSKKNISNVLNTILNDQLISIIMDKSGVDKDISASELSRHDRKNIVSIFKNFELKLSKKVNYKNAVVTSGGVDLKEINPKTMESKLVKDLYFIGEVLDIDALTGGFNLQIAFTTAYAASLDIKEKIWHI